MLIRRGYRSNRHDASVMYEFDVYDLGLCQRTERRLGVVDAAHVHHARTLDLQVESVSACDVLTGGVEYDPPLIQRHLRDT